MSVPFQYKQLYRDLYEFLSNNRPLTGASFVSFVRLLDPQYPPDVVEKFAPGALSGALVDSKLTLSVDTFLSFIATGQKALGGIPYDTILWQYVANAVKFNLFGGETTCELKEVRAMVDPLLKMYKKEAELTTLYKAHCPAYASSPESGDTAVVPISAQELGAMLKELGKTTPLMDVFRVLLPKRRAGKSTAVDPPALEATAAASSATPTNLSPTTPTAGTSRPASPASAPAVGPASPSSSQPPGGAPSSPAPTFSTDAQRDTRNDRRVESPVVAAPPVVAEGTSARAEVKSPVPPPPPDSASAPPTPVKTTAPAFPTTAGKVPESTPSTADCSNRAAVATAVGPGTTTSKTTFRGVGDDGSAKPKGRPASSAGGGESELDRVFEMRRRSSRGFLPEEMPSGASNSGGLGSGGGGGALPAGGGTALLSVPAQPRCGRPDVGRSRSLSDISTAESAASNEGPTSHHDHGSSIHQQGGKRDGCDSGKATRSGTMRPVPTHQQSETTSSHAAFAIAGPKTTSSIAQNQSSGATSRPLSLLQQRHLSTGVVPLPAMPEEVEAFIANLDLQRKQLHEQLEEELEELAGVNAAVAVLQQRSERLQRANAAYFSIEQLYQQREAQAQALETKVGGGAATQDHPRHSNAVDVDAARQASPFFALSERRHALFGRMEEWLRIAQDENAFLRSQVDMAKADRRYDATSAAVAEHMANLPHHSQHLRSQPRGASPPLMGSVSMSDARGPAASTGTMSPYRIARFYNEMAKKDKAVQEKQRLLNLMGHIDRRHREIEGEIDGLISLRSGSDGEEGGAEDHEDEYYPHHSAGAAERAAAVASTGASVSAVAHQRGVPPHLFYLNAAEVAITHEAGHHDRLKQHQQQQTRASAVRPYAQRYFHPSPTPASAPSVPAPAAAQRYRDATAGLTASTQLYSGGMLEDLEAPIGGGRTTTRTRNSSNNTIHTRASASMSAGAAAAEGMFVQRGLHVSQGAQQHERRPHAHGHVGSSSPTTSFSQRPNHHASHPPHWGGGGSLALKSHPIVEQLSAHAHQHTWTSEADVEDRR